jgi:hypothetical protein
MAEPADAQIADRLANLPPKLRTRERERLAVGLALAGVGFDEIAAQVGYANRSGAWKAVERALQRGAAQDVETLRELELARLDAMQAGLWNAARKGQLGPVDRVLAVQRQRARYVPQLMEPERFELGGTRGKPVVVEFVMPEPETVDPVPEEELQS